jgi:putative transposase
MPRHQRLDLADVAQHVIQRGNNRQPCFFREIDYVRYQQDLREAAVDAGVDIHAYAKMGAVARMMQSLGRRYVRYVNDALGRTGTLWEGRFKSSLVDSERYLLACYRYIELNPVRAGMVADASSYQWSSLGSNGFGRADGVITPHPAYLQLHPQQDERQARYRAFLMEGISDDELAAIRTYAQRQRALGTDKFRKAIEQQLGRTVGLGKPGRPRKGQVESGIAESGL